MKLNPQNFIWQSIIWIIIKGFKNRELIYIRLTCRHEVWIKLLSGLSLYSLCELVFLQVIFKFIMTNVQSLKVNIIDCLGRLVQNIFPMCKSFSLASDSLLAWAISWKWFWNCILETMLPFKFMKKLCD